MTFCTSYYTGSKRGTCRERLHFWGYALVLWPSFEHFIIFLPCFMSGDRPEYLLGFRIALATRRGWTGLQCESWFSPCMALRAGVLRLAVYYWSFSTADTRSLFSNLSSIFPSVVTHWNGVHLGAVTYACLQWKGRQRWRTTILVCHVPRAVLRF